ncbi:ABC transporter ATP-binding protein [Pseudodesulfovibrio senegalensis]|nr:ABC transporter ATP-binding protein [Pseudodesulfovibrio senegalensis]
MTTQTETMRSTPLSATWARMQKASGDQVSQLRRCMLFSTLSAVVQGLAFACFYPLLDAVLAAPADWDRAWLWVAALAACTVLDIVFIWIARGFDYAGPIADVTHNLRLVLGRHLRNMPLEALDKKRSGELAAVLAGNVDEVVTPMGMLSSAFLGIVVTPVVAVAATAFVDWRLALAMVSIVPLALPLYYWRRRAAGRGYRAIAKAHARTSAELVEYAQGLAVLRATNQVGKKARRLQAALENLRDVQEREQWCLVWPGVLYSSLVQVGLLVVMALGVWFILSGTLSVAVLAALLVVVVRFSEPLALLFGISPVFDYMEAGLEQVEKLLAVRPLPVADEPEQPSGFEVGFKDVRFRYSGTDEDVLKNVSFTLPEHSLSALVGPSGSGKTTITRLLMRHADPQQGTVRIGGADVRTMDQLELMRHVSVVFQDVYLFDDTILANIRMGRPDADDAAVEAAARAAHCHEFITRLPDGYQTRVGDIGGCLSGGERQRISIARAILKDAPIVILDEPTAALDTESEVAVQKAIDTLVGNRTVIVIAHRLSTIVGADAILVIEDGEVAQKGTHAELLEQPGRYRAMWQAQQCTKDWHLAAVKDAQ